MAFIFSKVSQSFRQDCENCWVSVRMWVSWGHTGRLLAKHSSLSCHPRWGLSSLHRCMNPMGCPTIRVYETFSYQQMPYLFSLCIQSGRTLAPTDLPLSFWGKEWHGLTILFALSLHNRDVPLCPCLESHWAQVWQSREILPKGAEYSRKSPSIIFVVDFCLLSPILCWQCPCFLLGSNAVPNPWCLVGAPNQVSSKVMHGVWERSLPLLQRPSPHPP